MTTVAEEQAAFDALPDPVRRTIIDCRVNVCCTKVLEYVRRGHQTREIIEAILQMDAAMVATHHQQLQTGEFARLRPH